MRARMDQTRTAFIADEAEAVIARRAAGSLKAVAEAHQSVKVSFGGPEAQIVVPLPASAVALLHAVLDTMANRTPISLHRHDADLSVQQAADFLNISRPFLIRQLDVGALAYHQVGAHRRVRFSDLMAYERQCWREQSKTLADLHDEEKRLGLD